MIGKPTRFVIIGAGQSGAWIARTLRKEGASGSIAVLGDERHLPYERPPLSKKGLTDGHPEESGVLLSRDEAAQFDIDLQLGVTATAIDRAARMIAIKSGAEIPYDLLFLAMGSRPRILPAAPPGPAVAYLRTRDDAARLRERLAVALRVFVLGGGWIGLEVASACVALGREVVLLEQAEQLCPRVLPPHAAQELATLHRRNGVDLRLGVKVEKVHIDLAARAPSGRVIVDVGGGVIESGDLMVVGIGGLPNHELAAAAGLRIDGGIVVDRRGATSDPRIFAAGDVARIEDPIAGLLPRLESWANAQDQAIAAARCALGSGQTYDAVPWFWSEQFGSRIQLAGLHHCGQQIHHRSGTGNGGWIQVGLDAGIARFACSMNAPREFRMVKGWIIAGTRVDPVTFVDPSRSLADAVVTN